MFFSYSIYGLLKLNSSSMVIITGIRCMPDVVTLHPYNVCVKQG